MKKGVHDANSSNFSKYLSILTMLQPFAWEGCYPFLLIFQTSFISLFFSVTFPASSSMYSLQYYPSLLWVLYKKKRKKSETFSLIVWCPIRKVRSDFCLGGDSIGLAVTR